MIESMASLGFIFAGWLAPCTEVNLQGMGQVTCTVEKSRDSSTWEVHFTAYAWMMAQDRRDELHDLFCDEGPGVVIEVHPGGEVVTPCS